MLLADIFRCASDRSRWQEVPAQASGWAFLQELTLRYCTGASCQSSRQDRPPRSHLVSTTPHCMVMGNSHNLPMPQFPSSRMKVTIMLSSWGSCETLLFQPPHSLSCPRMCDLCWQHLLTTDEDQEYQHPNSLAPAWGCPRLVYTPALSCESSPSRLSQDSLRLHACSSFPSWLHFPLPSGLPWEHF